MTDDVLEARIHTRIVEIERAACATLRPVIELRLLAAFTAANFVLARSPERLSPCALPGYLIEPISRTTLFPSRRGAGLLFRRND
jgi:hypothetical protein